MRLKNVADVESGIHLSVWKVNPLKLALGRQGFQTEDGALGAGSSPGPQLSASWDGLVGGWEAETAWPLAGAVVLTQSVCDDVCAVKHHG